MLYRARAVMGHSETGPEEFGESSRVEYDEVLTKREVASLYAAAVMLCEMEEIEDEELLAAITKLAHLQGLTGREFALPKRGARTRKRS